MTKGASQYPTMIPWGRLSDGKLGLAVSDADGIQKNSVLEVWDTLANAQANGTDFPGRTILDTTTGLVYIFDPTQGVGGDYRELGSLPATVGNVGGNPPTVPTPLSGELFWDLDTKVCYVWDGTRWEPIGGRYAGQFVSAYHPSVSGVQGSFSLGLTAAQIDSIQGAPQNVEAFIDGVRQSYAAGEFFVTGGTITFPIPPAGGTNLYTRTLVSDVIAPTAEVTAIEHVVPVGPDEDTFSTGVTGVSRTGTFVYINGVMQTGPEAGSASPDYDIDSQDTCITKLEVTDSIIGEVTVTTNAPHGQTAAGVQTIIDNIIAEPLYEGTFSVTAFPTANTFTVINPNAIGGLATLNDPTCATGMYYTPAFLDDQVVLTTPVPAGTKVLIKSVRNLTTVEASGEVNEGTNIGAGIPVYSTKAGTDLVFRTILAGANISVVDTGNEVLINSTSANTFEDRNGINTTYHLLGATESYIGVLSTTSAVTIDLSSVVDVTDAGRRIVIKDESGGAAINNITIIHAGKTFDGQPNYVISSNFGVITLVFSGANWFTTTGGTTGGGGGSPVTSVFGRVGAVLAQSGDYNAAKISYSNVSSGLAALDVQNAIDEVAQNVLPTGVMMPWGGDLASVPAGWLVCDGSTLGNTLSGAVYQGVQYENLFNIVKTLTGGASPYNTGLEDFSLNQTTRLPDMRGRTVFGPNGVTGRLATSTEVPEGNVPGASGGEDRHTLTEPELASHDHDIGSQNLVTTGSGTEKATGANNWGTQAPTTDTAGNDQAHNTVPPFQMMYWIIKV